jgi:hypothetical protein
MGRDSRVAERSGAASAQREALVIAVQQGADAGAHREKSKEDVQ